MRDINQCNHKKKTLRRRIEQCHGHNFHIWSHEIYYIAQEKKKVKEKTLSYD